jgi:ParB-like chromosome segregation protein Spo0J
MSDHLEPHPLAALFPAIPEEELAELGRDIALHGQLEPIVLYQGKILDGVNRYQPCRRMAREPWTNEIKLYLSEHCMVVNISK